MDKTVESYRTALEREISRWNGFARALRKDDKEAFDELMDMGRSHASESSNATQTAIFEPMAMSIILCQQENMRQIEKALNAIQPAPTTPLENMKPKAESQHAVAVYSKKKNPGGEQARLQ
jgi:hypothetical protein